MREQSLNPANGQTSAPDKPGSYRLAVIYGALLALGYLALGVWSATTGKWQGGAWLWPEGLAGLPVQVPQGLSLALLIGWLLFGLTYPVSAVRPWAWVVLGLFQVVVLMLAGWWLVALVVTLLHGLAFDPRWLGRVVPSAPEAMFYDGYCGLCHRWVKVVMHADHDGSLFYFAPLQGNTIQQLLTPEQRNNLPDSIVVRTSDGRVLSKSSAIIRILTALGGWHRLGAILMRLIPRVLRDLGYDTVAKVRHRLFAKPSDACPMMPEHLRGRFKF